MKRVLLLLALALVVVLGVRWVVLALVPDETKIRWVVEEMEEGFNEGSAKRSVSGLAEDWSHEHARGMTAELLQRYLFGEFQGMRAQGDHRLDARVEVDEDELSIQVDGQEASLDGEATFSRLQAGEWVPNWRVRFHARLEDRDDGWLVVRSSSEDLEGRGIR